MKQGTFKVESNSRIAERTYRMLLSGDASDIALPGQFINIRLDGYFLRRPLSVCDFDSGSVTVVYKVVGEGTDYMSALSRGACLDVLTGLGNGFDTSKSGRAPLLIGGGAGAPPMYSLCKKLIGESKAPAVILGFNKKEEVFFVREFESLGADVTVATADGSLGVKGFVTDAMETVADYSYIYACGPEPMLKAVCDVSPTGGQYSFEARMGCGFGACMGCSRETHSGPKRICREGPVLEKEDIIW